MLKPPKQVYPQVFRKSNCEFNVVLFFAALVCTALVSILSENTFYIRFMWLFRKFCVHMAHRPCVSYVTCCCLSGHSSMYWIGSSLVKMLLTKLHIDIVHKPCITYRTYCCLSDHPSKYWKGLSLFRGSNGNRCFKCDLFVSLTLCSPVGWGCRIYIYIPKIIMKGRSKTSPFCTNKWFIVILGIN